LEKFWETASRKYGDKTERAQKYFRNICWLKIREMKYGSPNLSKSAWEPNVKNGAKSAKDQKKLKGRCFG